MLNKRRKDTTEKSEIPKKRLHEKYLKLKRKQATAFFSRSSKYFLQQFKNSISYSTFTSEMIPPKLRTNNLGFSYFFVREFCVVC